jgi:hypothetical protein
LKRKTFSLQSVFRKNASFGRGGRSKVRFFLRKRPFSENFVIRMEIGLSSVPLPSVRAVRAISDRFYFMGQSDPATPSRSGPPRPALFFLCFFFESDVHAAWEEVQGKKKGSKIALIINICIKFSIFNFS